MKKSIYCFLVAIIFILIVFCANGTVYAAEEDVYDVILFWGQSNMIGYAGLRTTEIGKLDERVTSIGKNNFAKYSGIDIDIINNYQSIDYTKVEQEAGTAYEYVYSTNSLKEINSTTKKLGETLNYNTDTKKLDLTNDSSKYSLLKSYGTNMIPQFCKTYYENTGRKVVAVLCGNGGEKISNFLPSTDSEYGDPKQQYIYEATTIKYKAAIKYLEDNNYNIGSKLYVVFQGEHDVVAGTSKDNYTRLFLKVHNNIKKDLGISVGAIVQSAYTIGVNDNGEYTSVKNINSAQLELISRNDIISGSSYPYNRYIPDEVTYNKSSYINNNFLNSAGGKLNYETAKKYAEYSVCSTTNNSIHFTSAALSQVGRDVAEAYSKVSKIEIVTAPKKDKYILNYEKLNLSGGKIKVTFVSGATREIDMTNANVKVSGFSNTSLGNKTISVTYGGKATTFNVTIVEKSLSTIKVSTAPKKTSYVEGQVFDKTGMVVTATYNDETSKAVTGYTISPSGALEKGTSKITISYKENGVTKTVAQNITVIKKGDVNEDNQVNFRDILVINNHRLGKTQLTGIYLQAADVTGDGSVNFMDILQINRYRLGKISNL